MNTTTYARDLDAARAADARIDVVTAALRALPFELRRMHGVHRATGAGFTLDYSPDMRGGDVYAMHDVDPGIGAMGGADVLSSFRVDDCPAGTRALLCELYRARHAAFVAWARALDLDRPVPVYVAAYLRHAEELETL